ncbi:MAG: TIGR02301 family protein [Alphaproteobacteria bacterium]|nr:TIGR02301 family protein [Alphaproteobacteria bacterium]
MRRLICAAAIALLALAAPAAAQSRAEPEAEAQPRLSYDEQVVELSTVLGGAHYLRILCSGRADQTWRDFMRGLIEREPNRSGSLSRAFNAGYRREEERFPVCTQGARNMEAELRAQGLRLADGLRASNAQ